MRGHQNPARYVTGKGCVECQSSPEGKARQAECMREYNAKPEAKAKKAARRARDVEIEV